VTSKPRWPAISAQNTALVGLALMANALVVIVVVFDEPLDAVLLVPVALLPGVALLLLDRPRGFRLATSLVALYYAGIAAVSLWFGGWVFAPSAALLAAAALAPPAREAQSPLARARGYGVFAVVCVIVLATLLVIQSQTT
jgi:hypothetical protein